MTTRISTSAHKVLKRPKPSFLDRWSKQLLSKVLTALEVGEIVIIDTETQRFGKITAEFSLSVTIEVKDTAFFTSTLLGGSLGSAESYMAGEWAFSDLVALVRILIRNRHVLEAVDGRWTFLTNPLSKVIHSLNRNTHSGSRKNIQAHYDLGNDLFKLFLDESMMYSCALFEREDMSLYEASIAKLDAICRKLQLKPSDHVVEIGSGWGGFAIYAASTYGCHVTTTTISDNQFKLAMERIREQGLEHKITLLKQDYRKLEGRFDKLVSIEMIEAVGHHYYKTFFKKCADLLKEDGLMLIQAITINDRNYRKARDEVDFIKRYIFPGSCIPAITALIGAATRGSDLQLISLDDIGIHYARTLRLWRERFLSRRKEISAQGYSDEFIKLWEFYLAYCEGGFEERALGDVHLLMSKPLYRG